MAVNIKNGKGDWVQKRNSNGTYKKICLFLNNIDFSTKCMSYINPIDQTNDISNACKYCYAKYKNQGNHEPSIFNYNLVKKHIKSRFDENPDFKYLRFGKNEDPGHEIYKPNLIKTFKILDELGGSGVLFSKFLKYDEEIAEWAKRTNSVLCFSLGYDRFESGPCSHGRNNKFRMKQALKYHEQGVNSILKLVTDVTVSPEIADSFGSNSQKALELRKKYGIYISLLPLRLDSKELAFDVTGVTWDFLLDRDIPLIEDEFEFRRGTYTMEIKVPKNIEDIVDNNAVPTKITKIKSLIPTKIHEAYQDFIDNKNICGKVGSLWSGVEYCDKCHMKDSKNNSLETVVFKQTLLPHIDSSKVKQNISQRQKVQRKEKREKEEAEKERKSKFYTPDLF